MLSIFMIVIFMLLMNFMISWEVILVALFMMMTKLFMTPMICPSKMSVISNFQLFHLSFFMIFLTILTFFWASGCMSMYSQENKFNSLAMLLISLMGFLLFFFLVENLMKLYIFFELSVVPIFMIIMGWGYQSERINASLSLFFYTMTASLPLLTVLLWMSKTWFLKSLISDIFCENSSHTSLIMMLCLVSAFLVKLPMFGVHIWLPKAHVEAPMFGSMILAAILLKLGSYGIWLFLPKIFHFLNLNWLFSLSLIGGTMVSLICIRLSDIKMIIAYSSVSHMGLVLIALIIFNISGSLGGLMLMLAHGASSSSMFLMSYYLYQFNYSRSMMLTKGMLTINSILPLMWFLVLMTNMAAPPSFNLASEIIVISSVVNYTKFNWVFLILIIFLGTVYSLIMYSSAVQGVKVLSLNNKFLSISEIASVVNHLVWGFGMIIALSVFMI